MGVKVDSELVARVVAASGERTIKAAVTKALQEFSAQRTDKKQRDLLNRTERVGSALKKARQGR